MPNRIIRDGILSSEKIAMLDFGAEVFYRRLMSVVDDYGRFEAGAQLLRARCFPLQTDIVKPEHVTSWIDACIKAELVILYVVNGKKYIQIINFGQQQRAASKYPQPPETNDDCKQVISDASKCYQVPANEHLVGVGVGVGVGDGGEVGVVNSVPNGTGAKAPMKPDEIIFGYGIPMLVNAGTPEKQARSFLGGLRKRAGDDVLINTLRECFRAKPLQPLEWLAAALPPEARKNAQEKIEDENRAVAKRFLEKRNTIEANP